MSQAWFELCDNPRAVSSLYSTAPDLEGVEVMELRAFRDGPRLQVVLDLPSFPEDPPARWRREGFNAVQLTLDLFLSGPLDLAGWTTLNRVDLSLTELESGGLRVVAVGPALRLRVDVASASIAGLSGYLDGARE